MKKHQGYGLQIFGILAVSCVIVPELRADAKEPASISLLGKSASPVTSAKPLTLSPHTGTWNFSRYDSLYFKLRNSSLKPVTVWAQAENAGAKGATDTVRSALIIEPKQSQTLRLRLMRRPADPTYAPFKPFYMYSKNINVRDNTIDPATVARISVQLEGASADSQVLVESVTATGAGIEGVVPFLPFIDKYGQYTHTDWPDKIFADSDLKARLKKEEAEMSAYPGPTDWDEWGGWKSGPKQKATGFFYPAKVDGKWWLVDPTGNLYWSYGPTGVGAGGDQSPITGKEAWFTELPPTKGPLAKYAGSGKNARYMYYENKEYKSYDFSSANAERKYGPKWREATTDFMHRRLRNWGFNTIANWSDSAVYMRRKTPYVVAVHYGGPKLEHIPDVFSPDFEKALRERMEAEKGKTANDPWNIGYFVDNELAWTYMNKAEGVIRGALRADASSATKQALIADLKAKYGEIAALNTSWGTEYASWETMQTMQTLPEPKNAAARGEDLGAFGLKFAEKYFSTARAAVKAVAPNNLYLGCRFHGHIDTEIVKIAAKYSDVISYNVYEEPGSRLNRYIGTIDKPFIVGEFGIGSDLGQTPFRGDKLSEAPEERVRAMENWVKRATVHPLVVGGHYFQFRDQPISARGDGEAVLRGFVNIADTPHFDLVQANRRLGYGLYEARAAKQAPAKTEEKVATPTRKLTYMLAEGSETWPADKKQRVVSAMDFAVALYNSLGEFDKQARASYNAGTPTADGNYNGNIRFGGQIGNRVALHELGHVLGIGTHPKWQSFIVDGKWTGTNALAQLRAFDGPDAVLYADRQHFWPYGLNFDSESSPEKDKRHVLMVAAFRRDLGIGDGKETAGVPAPATLAGSNFLTLPGNQWKLKWNDEFEGTTLDKTKWDIGLPWGGTDGTGRHHNDQYASYIMDDDINVRGGSLHLTTQKRDIVDKKGNTFRYSEGLITTNKTFRTKYGYFEIRAKMPTEAGAGTWPAFWTLSDGWPPEFDIIEYWGSDNRIHQGTVTRKPDGNQRWDSYHLSQANVSGWHTYGLEWGPGYQHYNIDGKITNSIYGEHLEDGKLHYLLLNSGVDARRPPRAGTTFPNNFEVQYVRVYARPEVPSLLNGDFENLAIAPWGRWNEAAIVDYGAKSGQRCLRVDTGGQGLSPASSMQQKVFGLQPNTKYTLTGFAKTIGGAAAQLGVKEHGADEVKSAEVVKQSADYKPLSLTFTTGEKATSATIYCYAEGDGSAFFDEIRLERAAQN